MANTLLPVGSASTILGLTGTADVSDELGRAGMSFGKLVETTGKAVAETQLKLNQTGAAMASVLATTQTRCRAEAPDDAPTQRVEWRRWKRSLARSLDRRASRPCERIGRRLT